MDNEKASYDLNSKYRITRLLGIIMVIFSFCNLVSIKDAPESESTTWQTIYLLLLSGGGFSNLVDCGGGLFATVACFFYILSAILGIFSDELNWNPSIVLIAFVVSFFRFVMVMGDEKKNFTGDIEKESHFSTEDDNYDLERYAQEILDDVNWNGDEVNKSVTVFDFTYSYEKLIEGLEELVRLNEEEGVSMTPPPRKDLETIQGGIELTIDKFIERSIANAQKAGEDEVELLLNSMTEDQTFWSLATKKNKDKINRRIFEIEQKRLRNEEYEKRIREQNRKKSILSKIGLESNIDCSDIDAMEVIKQMEYSIELIFKYFKESAFSPKEGENMFLSFKKSCETSKLPLAAEVRLESLLNEYESKFKIPNPFYFVDRMSGHKFENWCADLLKRSGFENVEVTPASGDQGVDVLAEKDGIRYAFQCKCYSSDLGNTPVQEVHAGKYIYHCHVGVVITNRHFTQGAKDAAQATGILLWDREKLQAMIDEVG